MPYSDQEWTKVDDVRESRVSTASGGDRRPSRRTTQTQGRKSRDIGHGPQCWNSAVKVVDVDDAGCY
eukprot:symbB.v1.2.017842.t1/scaffold1399.1/size121348/5